MDLTSAARPLGFRFLWFDNVTNRCIMKLVRYAHVVMTRRSQYLAGAFVVAPLWFCLSFVLSLALAGAEDNMDMSAPVPLWLRAAWGIAFFPMRYIRNWDYPPAGMSDHAFALYGMGAMFINGLIWGLIFVFSWRLVARFIATKKRVVQDTVPHPL